MQVHMGFEWSELIDLETAIRSRMGEIQAEMECCEPVGPFQAEFDRLEKLLARVSSVLESAA